MTGRVDIMDGVHAGGLGGTYGGNPVACAAALASIGMMRELDLAAAARRIGAVTLERLLGLQNRFRQGALRWIHPEARSEPTVVPRVSR